MAENKKSNQADAYMESMKAYQKTYDFLLYLYPILSQFPKFEKFALQSQIKTAVFEMLKSVIRFRKTGTKSHIYNADVELQFIKTLIRLSYDLEYPAMSKHRYEVLSKKMTELGCIPYFVRYMDDFIILSDDLEQLKEWVKRIEEFLENEMLLHINPKSTILYAGNGIDFCGYIHYADHKKVRKSSIRKLKQDVKAYELGELPPEEFNRKYESRKGHLGHADTYHIAKAVEYELLFYEWERLEAAA